MPLLQPAARLPGPSLHASSFPRPLRPAPAPVLHASSGGRGRRRRLGLFRSCMPVHASFDLSNFNFNPLDYLKVPRDQTQLTMYPWLEAHQQRERMRHWLQQELCMSDAQARATLATCPALGQLDVRLAQRRLKQLDRQMGINRCQAALLVLRRPHTLLPPASDVVGYALEARGKRRPPGPRS